MGERFAQFEEDTVPTFQPEVDQVYAGARRLRHKRRVGLVTAAVVLLAVPAIWIGANQDQKKADAPADSPVRRVNVPGVTMLDAPKVSFMDANLGFAIYNRCRATEDPMCHHAAGVTTDRGRTWKSLRLPEIPDQLEITIYGKNAAEFAVYANPAFTMPAASKSWFTRDGGATYTEMTKTQPDLVETQWGFGEYDIECPALHVGEGRHEKDPACTTKLVKRGSGPIDPQPADLGLLPMVLSGRDGRIWLVDRDSDQQPHRVRVSADQGKTWQDLPSVPQDSAPMLSWDGTDVYVAEHPGQWIQGKVNDPLRISRLIAGKWVEQYTLPSEYSSAGVTAVGDGAVLVIAQPVGQAPSDVYYVKDGQRLPLPMVIAPGAAGAQFLPDGTVLITVDNVGQYLGVGSGIDREWTFITY